MEQIVLARSCDSLRASQHRNLCTGDLQWHSGLPISYYPFTTTFLFPDSFPNIFGGGSEEKKEHGEFKLFRKALELH